MRALAPSSQRSRHGWLAAAVAMLALALPAGALAAPTPFLNFKHNTTVGGTIPFNGDLNPYGVAPVTTTTGRLVAGNVLVSNFNNEENEQGRGSTIVQVTPRGRLSVFAQISPGSLPGPCPGGVGLTTALAILPQGFVVVGSLPTSTGKAPTAMAGCLIVLDSTGQPVETISGPLINGPWDMTAVSAGPDSTLFVTNVLNNTVANGETVTDEGTVVRIRVHVPAQGAPRVRAPQVIAEGFPERTDKEALVIGPTGVALGQDGTLYVADTLGNRIAAVKNALGRGAPLTGAGRTVAAGGFLEGPLGLTLAPNGDILTANSGNGNIVETTPTGAQFPPFETEAGAGGLFGLAVAPNLHGLYYVNDAHNLLALLH